MLCPTCKLPIAEPVGRWRCPACGATGLSLENPMLRLARAVDAHQKQVAKHLEQCLDAGLFKPETTVREAMDVLRKIHPLLDTKDASDSR